MDIAENNKEPLVSISCITFNHVNYIRQCLDGFLMQKTNFSFEILIHDDASTDGTEEIIRKYEAKYPEIIKPQYEIENQWIKGRKGSAVFNFPRAVGKYIALCEGDDYWIEPNKLQNQFDFMENNPDYSLCFHNAIVINECKNYTLSYFNNFHEERDISISEIINLWCIPTASIFFRNLKIIPLPLWAINIYSGDLTLALLLSDLGKVRYLNNTMAVYRKNINGISIILKDKIRFVADQKIHLLNLFNSETNGKYKELINKFTFDLNRLTQYTIYKNQFVMFPFLIMPLYTLKRVLFKLIRPFKNKS